MASAASLENNALHIRHNEQRPMGGSNSYRTGGICLFEQDSMLIQPADTLIRPGYIIPPAC